MPKRRIEKSVLASKKKQFYNCSFYPASVWGGGGGGGGRDYLFPVPRVKKRERNLGATPDKMAATMASDYLNEMRRYFETNSRTKDFVAHTAKVSKEKNIWTLYVVILF